MEIQAIMKDGRVHMEKAVDSTGHELSGIRSGKASPSMLDTVRVEMYGSTMSLNQVASVTAPEPRIILVTPFDKSQAKTIEKAIRDAGLGFDPAQQGNVIRVPLPSMTEERRKDLVKILHRLVEEGRIAVRHARTDVRDKLKKLTGVPEDDVKHAEKDLQKMHDEHIQRIEALLKAKEAEIMEV